MNVAACPRFALLGAARTRRGASVACAARASEPARGPQNAWVRHLPRAAPAPALPRPCPCFRAGALFPSPHPPSPCYCCWVRPTSAGSPNWPCSGGSGWNCVGSAFSLATPWLRPLTTPRPIPDSLPCCSQSDHDLVPSLQHQIPVPKLPLLSVAQLPSPSVRRVVLTTPAMPRACVPQFTSFPAPLSVSLLAGPLAYVLPS